VYWESCQALYAVAGQVLALAAQAGAGFSMPVLEGRWWVEDERSPLLQASRVLALITAVIKRSDAVFAFCAREQPDKSRRLAVPSYCAAVRMTVTASNQSARALWKGEDGRSLPR
jgi:hypothetical protein